MLNEARELAPNGEAADIIVYLKDIYDQLTALGYEKHLFIDLGLVHSIHYYTGLVFRGYLKGYGDVVLSGGRYDKLSQSFEKDLCSTGFAVYVDSILGVLLKNIDDIHVNPRPKALIHYEEGCIKQANLLLDELSKEGVRAQISLCDTQTESQTYAKIHGIETIYVVSKDGIQKIAGEVFKHE